LAVAGTNYEGTNCPQGVSLVAGSTISWTSDGSVSGDGWEICGTSASSSDIFTVTNGPCITYQGGQCVGRASGYGNNEACTITTHRVTTLGQCPVFVTETGYDHLAVAGTNYEGTNCPQGVSLVAGSTISWTSDGSVSGDGWEICGNAGGH
jgi:hypothetical protein